MNYFGPLNNLSVRNSLLKASSVIILALSSKDYEFSIKNVIEFVDSLKSIVKEQNFFYSIASPKLKT